MNPLTWLRAGAKRPAWATRLLNPTWFRFRWWLFHRRWGWYFRWLDRLYGLKRDDPYR